VSDEIAGIFFIIDKTRRTEMKYLEDGTIEYQKGDKAEFKIGDWLTMTSNQFLMKITELLEEDEYGDFKGIGWNWKGKWRGKSEPLDFRGLRLATLKEITEAFAKEAKKRGYKPGVTVEYSGSHNNVQLGEDENPIYYKEDDQFYMYGYQIYNKGEWYKIADEKKIMIGSHEVIFSERTISVGCYSIDNRMFKRFYTGLPDGLESVKIKGEMIFRDTLADIFDRVSRK